MCYYNLEQKCFSSEAYTMCQVIDKLMTLLVCNKVWNDHAKGQFKNHFMFENKTGFNNKMPFNSYTCIYSFNIKVHNCSKAFQTVFHISTTKKLTKTDTE